MDDKAKERLYDAKRGSDRRRVTEANPAHGNGKLVPVRKTVRKKNGLTYVQTFWVTPEEAKEQGLENGTPNEYGGAGGGGGAGYAPGALVSGNAWGADAAASNFLIRLMEAARKDEPKRFEALGETDSRRRISSVSYEERKSVESAVTAAWNREPFYKVRGVYKLGEGGSGKLGFFGGTACDIIELLRGNGLSAGVWLTNEADTACGMCAVDGWENGDLYRCGLASIRVILVMRGEYGRPWTMENLRRRDGAIPGNLSRLVNSGENWICVPELLYAVEFE